MSIHSDDDLGLSAGDDAEQGVASPSNAPNAPHTANPLFSPQNLLQETLAAARGCERIFKKKPR